MRHPKTVVVYRRHLLPYSETFIRRQVLALTRWRPVLVGEVEPEGLTLDGIDVRHLSVRTGVVARQPNARRFWAALQLLGLRRRDANSAFQHTMAFRGLAKERPKLLHVHFGTNAVEARHLASALNIPMIVTLHGYDITKHAAWWESGAGGRQNRDYPKILRSIADDGAVFVVVSDAIAESAVEFGIPERSLRKIIIGTDLTAFRQSAIPMAERLPRILFVGRFVEKKGVDHLLEGFRLVKNEIPQAELRLIGDGKLQPDLVARAKQLEMQVDFLGRLPPEEVIREMHEARVLCAPSIRTETGDSEGLPTVIMEAQACGLPVVTSARGGATEGIDDPVTGRAFKESDVRTMADLLIAYLRDSKSSEAAATAARKLAAERFDINRNTKALESLYDEVAGSRR